LSALKCRGAIMETVMALRREKDRLFAELSQVCMTVAMKDECACVGTDVQR
jgi:hypothetical protein